MTDDQFVAHVMTLARRLGNALDTLDAGDVSAAADLAGHLRTLLGAAKGNRALQRLADLPGAHLPWVTVGHAPTEVETTIISVGYLPLERPTQPPPNEHTISFFDWIKRTAIIYPGTVQRTASWSKFVTDAGNTFGSHISKSTPDYLHQATLFGIANLNLTDYLLRQIAWAAERALEKTLLSLGQTVTLHERPLEFYNSGIRFLHNFMDGPAMRLSIEFRLSSFPAEILQFELEGTHRFLADENGKPQWVAPPGFIDRKPLEVPTAPPPNSAAE